jgi:hypothetical protein
MDLQLLKLKEFTPFTTWLQLYQHLEKVGLADQDFVKIEKARNVSVGPYEKVPDEFPEPEIWTVLLSDVRAGAFLEIYPKLPTMDDVAHIKSNMEYPTLVESERERLFKILDNIFLKK